MSSKELDNLVAAGLLKEEPPNQREFDGLLASAEKRFRDAKNGRLTADSRFDLAYGAAHGFALGAMRWHGYRPAKRYIVFQALQHTLHLGPGIWRVLDKCHALRNASEYEGRFDVDEQMLPALLEATAELERRVRALPPIRAEG